jgi:hypothetical protein
METSNPLYHIHAARTAFTHRHPHLSQAELEQEWLAMCTSGADPSQFDVPRSIPSSAWAPTSVGLLFRCEINKSNSLQTEDFSNSHQMNRNHGLSVQSAPAVLSRDSSFQYLDANSRSYSTSDQSSWKLDTATTNNPHTSTNSRNRNRPTPLPEVIEATTYDVGEYLLVNSLSPLSYDTSYSPHEVSSQDPNRLSVSGFSPQYTWGSPTESLAVSSPTTASLTSASTHSSTDMSRTGSVQSNFSYAQNSLPSTFTSSFDMMRMRSDVSNFSTSASQSDQHFSSSVSQPPSKTQDGARSRRSRQVPYVSRSKRSSVTLSSSDAIASNSSSQSPSYHVAPSMQRSNSSQSTSSASSVQNSSRSARRHHDTLLQQKNTPILPKSSDSAEVETHKMARMKSDDGSWKQYGVIPRKQQTYQRPQHPKLYCRYCKDHPDGFRGEHELQRHTNRAHSTRRKVWVCVEPSPNGFLANCKACRTKKKYGAYYNAAAQWVYSSPYHTTLTDLTLHSLRRAHFNPRKRGRKAKTEAEKRGGKGGGDWPPMQTLKENWMREIEEVVNDQSQPLAPESNTDDDELFDNDSEPVLPATISSILPAEYVLDSSNAIVENMLDPSTFGGNAGAVNFEYDTYGVGGFEIPCASDVMSQAVGLSNFRPHIAFDSVSFDESCQQQQSALFNEESVPSQEWM